MCIKNLNILSLNAEGMIPNYTEIKIPELKASKYIINDDYYSVYVRCPHCGNGYLSKLVSITADTERHIVYELLVNTGSEIIDLCKEQVCYVCHNSYIPTKQSHMIRTDGFIMQKVMEIKGK